MDRDEGWNRVSGEMAEALIAAVAVGVPMPDRRLGVGKRMRDCLWLHRTAAERLDAPWREAEARLPSGFTWDILRWRADGAAAFIRCADFDTSEEPTVGASALVLPGAAAKVTRPPADPLIYHHRWSFVLPDHGGFDTLASIRRSTLWRRAVGRDRAISSRIGRRSYWTTVILHRIRAD